MSRAVPAIIDASAVNAAPTVSNKLLDFWRYLDGAECATLMDPQPAPRGSAGVTAIDAQRICEDLGKECGGFSYSSAQVQQARNSDQPPLAEYCTAGGVLQKQVKDDTTPHGYAKWGNMARYSANFTMRFKGWAMSDARQVYTSVRAVVADFAAISVIDVVLNAAALPKEQPLEYNLLVQTDDKEAADGVRSDLERAAAADTGPSASDQADGLTAMVQTEALARDFSRWEQLTSIKLHFNSQGPAARPPIEDADTKRSGPERDEAQQLKRGQLVHRLTGLCAAAVQTTHSVELIECAKHDALPQQWNRMQPKQHGTKVELLQSAQLSTCIQPEHPESDGAVLMLRECIGGSGKPIQQWQFNSTSGTVQHVESGRCLDVDGEGTGSSLVLWDCAEATDDDDANQRWHFEPKVTAL